MPAMTSRRLPRVTAAALVLLAACGDRSDSMVDPLDPAAPAADPVAEPAPICADLRPLLDDACFDLVGPPGEGVGERAQAFVDDRDAYALIAVHVPDDPHRSAEREAAHLAAHLMVDRINRAGGLGPGADGGPQLAALLCTDGATEPGHAAGVRAGAHAVSCGARALVGAHSTGPTLSLFREVARPTGTPMVTAGAGSAHVDDVLSGSAGRDLLWRVIAPTDRAVEAAATLVEASDAYRAVHVFYRAGDPDDAAALAALRSRPGTAEFVLHGLDDPPHALAPAVSAALMAQPVDAVISLVGDPLGQLELTAGVIEATARAGVEADLLLVDGWAHPGTPQLLATRFAHHPEAVVAALCRTLVLVPGGEGPAFDTWALMTSLAASADLAEGAARDLYAVGVARIGTPLLVGARFADAVAVTALALAAADRQAVPPAIGVRTALDAMRHTDAPSVSVLDWPAARDALDPGADFVGASGPIDFAPEGRTLSTRRVELWRYLVGPDGPGRWGVDAVGPILSDDDPAALDWRMIDLLARGPNAPIACAGAPPRLLDR